MAQVVVGLNKEVCTCFDGRSEDRSVSHIARDRHSISRWHLIDTFRLPLVLILNAAVDSLFFFFQFSKDRLSSSNKFVFSLIRTIKLSLVTGGILIILHKT